MQNQITSGPNDESTLITLSSHTYIGELLTGEFHIQTSLIHPILQIFLARRKEGSANSCINATDARDLRPTDFLRRALSENVPLENGPVVGYFGPTKPELIKYAIVVSVPAIKASRHVVFTAAARPGIAQRAPFAASRLRLIAKLFRASRHRLSPTKGSVALALLSSIASFEINHYRIVAQVVHKILLCPYR